MGTIYYNSGELQIEDNLTISGNFPTVLTVTGNTNVTLPTTGTIPNQDYVDSAINGLKWKNVVDLAAAIGVNIASLSGEQLIDGILTSGSRILLWQQTDQKQNGLYLTSAGAWTRTSDANTGAEIFSMACTIAIGDTLAGRSFRNSNSAIPTIGVDNITFVDFGASISHNSTISKQGGTTNEYYHLTSAQHTDLTAGFNGTGNIVRATSTSLTTPNIGAATGTTLNLTANANQIVLDSDDGSGFTTTITDSATAARVLTLPDVTSTIATIANKLSAFAATTSAELAGVISDETGTGALVFGTSPTFTTQITTPSIINAGNIAITATNSAIPITIGTGAGDDFTINTTGFVYEGDTGNVGIGTSSPALTLAVNGIENLPATSGTTAKGSARITNTSNIAVDIGGSNTSPYPGWIQVHDASDQSVNYPLALNPNGGNVGIGTSSPGYKLEVSTDSAAKPSTNTWTISSDARLKDNIIPADLQRCYDIVKSVPLKRYTWKDDVYNTEQVADRSKLGFIAQDVQLAFPKGVGVHEFQGVELTELDVNGNPVQETYEEQDSEIRTISETRIDMVNGVPVQKQIKREVIELIFNEVNVVDETGAIVLKKDGTPLIHKIPKMITKTRDKKIRTIIPDCLDLNADQMYAAMYGTVQRLIAKVEALEAAAI